MLSDDERKVVINECMRLVRERLPRASFNLVNGMSSGFAGVGVRSFSRNVGALVITHHDTLEAYIIRGGVHSWVRSRRLVDDGSLEQVVDAMVSGERDSDDSKIMPNA